jgi:hypothetical protein
VALDLKDLEEFIGRIKKPLRNFVLRDTHLLSGTWARGLDILRYSQLRGIEFHSPSGAEMVALYMQENYFGMRAYKYVSGIISRNPFLHVVDESSEIDSVTSPVGVTDAPPQNDTEHSAQGGQMDLDS